MIKLHVPEPVRLALVISATIVAVYAGCTPLVPDTFEPAAAGGSAGATFEAGSSGAAADFASSGRSEPPGESGAAGSVGGEGGTGTGPGASGETGASGSGQGEGGASATPLEFDYYVDAAAGADDSNDGSRELPFKTITHALRVASESGVPRRIYVADGLYDSVLGEELPLVLRGGTSLHGAGPERVTIQGMGPYVSSNGSNDGLKRVTILMGDHERETLLTGVSLRSGWTHAVPAYDGVICDRGDAGATSPIATTRIENVVFEPGYYHAIHAVSSRIPADSACRLVLRDSRFEGAVWGVIARGCAWGTLSGRDVSVQIGEPGHGNTFRGMRASTHHGAGVLLQHCVVDSSIDDNVFSDGVGGVWIHQFAPAVATSRIAVRRNVFRRLLWTGVFVRGLSPVLDELADNHFENVSTTALGYSPELPPISAAALLVEGDEGRFPPLRARRNTFLYNDVAVRLSSALQISPAEAANLDFGTPSSPGQNVFRCNARRGVAIRELGGDVELEVSGTGSLPFFGNVWDHAPPRAGHHTSAPDGIEVLSWVEGTPDIDLGAPQLRAGTCPE